MTGIHDISSVLDAPSALLHGHLSPNFVVGLLVYPYFWLVG
jgi:hypothetical protein